MAMKTAVRTRWTVVQHSGAGYGGNQGFAQALEVRSLATKKEQEVVLKAGGKLFDSWKEANDYEEKINLGGEGIYPQAPGTFAEVLIDGLKVYIPPVGG